MQFEDPGLEQRSFACAVRQLIPGPSKDGALSPGAWDQKGEKSAPCGRPKRARQVLLITSRKQLVMG